MALTSARSGPSVRSLILRQHRPRPRLHQHEHQLRLRPRPPSATPCFSPSRSFTSSSPVRLPDAQQDRQASGQQGQQQQPLAPQAPSEQQSPKEQQASEPDAAKELWPPLWEQPDSRPRWSYTPERMKGPGFSLNTPKRESRTRWAANDDPRKLDAMYIRLLGPQGEKMLPDEIKWLAITHKSFDYGRRGFNTKLAYFGRLILSLEAMRAILAGPAVMQQLNARSSRVPFDHPALANVNKLSQTQPSEVISKERMARLAVEIGLPAVMRWKPRMPENLETSGIVPVLNTGLYAIVGAISLQQGAEVAERVVRDKILRRL